MMHDRAICVVCREGTTWSNKLTLKTAERLKVLKKEGYSIVIEYIGSEGDISNILYEAATKFKIRAKADVKNPKGLSEAVSNCYKNSIYTARESAETRIIFTAEGDNPDIIYDIPGHLTLLDSERADIVLPRRPEEGISKFPFMQRNIEKLANKYISKLAGVDGDFTYEPRAFNLSTSHFLTSYPRRDWGILTYPVVYAAIKGYQILSPKTMGFPQENYLERYPDDLRSPFAQFKLKLSKSLAHVLAAHKAKVDAKLN